MLDVAINQLLVDLIKAGVGQWGKFEKPGAFAMVKLHGLGFGGALRFNGVLELAQRELAKGRCLSPGNDPDLSLR
jgi:hypothetical protein